MFTKQIWGRIYKGEGPMDRLAFLMSDTGLGDCIHTLPALRQLVLDGYSVHVAGSRKWSSLIARLGCELIPEHLHGLGHHEYVQMNFSRIRHLSGWCYDHESCTLGNPVVSRIEQFARFGKVKIAPPFDFSTFLRARHKPTGKIIVHAESSQGLRSFHKDIPLLSLLEKRLGLEVIRIGSSSDYEFPDVQSLIDFIAGGDLVIGVDSGIIAIAGSLGIPTVGLFGPTDGGIILDQFKVWSRNKYIDSIRSPILENDGCQKPCWFSEDRGFHRCEKKTKADCLEELSLTTIVDKAEVLLSYWKKDRS